MRLRSCFIGIFLAAGAIAAHADEQPAALECAKVSIASARLACYDALFRGAPAAQTAKADPANEFGMTETLRGEAQDRIKPAELPKRIRAKIVAANPLPSGLYRLELDNGQTWVTKEAMWDVSFAAGQDVFLDRGVLNSYRISPVDRPRFLTAKRVK
jgi:hypothetical protein